MKLDASGEQGTGSPAPHVFGWVLTVGGEYNPNNWGLGPKAPAAGGPSKAAGGSL